MCTTQARLTHLRGRTRGCSRTMGSCASHPSPRRPSGWQQPLNMHGRAAVKLRTSCCRCRNGQPGAPRACSRAQLAMPLACSYLPSGVSWHESPLQKEVGSCGKQGGKLGSDENKRSAPLSGILQPWGNCQIALPQCITQGFCLQLYFHLSPQQPTSYPMFQPSNGAGP